MRRERQRKKSKREPKRRWLDVEIFSGGRRRMAPLSLSLLLSCSPCLVLSHFFRHLTTTGPTPAATSAKVRKETACSDRSKRSFFSAVQRRRPRSFFTQSPLSLSPPNLNQKPQSAPAPARAPTPTAATAPIAPAPAPTPRTTTPRKPRPPRRRDPSPRRTTSRPRSTGRPTSRTWSPRATSARATSTPRRTTRSRRSLRRAPTWPCSASASRRSRA